MNFIDSTYMGSRETNAQKLSLIDLCTVFVRKTCKFLKCVGKLIKLANWNLKTFPELSISIRSHPFQSRRNFIRKLLIFYIVSSDFCFPLFRYVLHRIYGLKKLVVNFPRSNVMWNDKEWITMTVNFVVNVRDSIYWSVIHRISSLRVWPYNRNFL